MAAGAGGGVVDGAVPGGGGLDTPDAAPCGSGKRVAREAAKLCGDFGKSSADGSAASLEEACAVAVAGDAGAVGAAGAGGWRGAVRGAPGAVVPDEVGRRGAGV